MSNPMRGAVSAATIVVLAASFAAPTAKATAAPAPGHYAVTTQNVSITPVGAATAAMCTAALGATGYAITGTALLTGAATAVLRPLDFRYATFNSGLNSQLVVEEIFTPTSGTATSQSGTQTTYIDGQLQASNSYSLAAQFIDSESFIVTLTAAVPLSATAGCTVVNSVAFIHSATR